jgi:acetylornithine deacetylase
LYRFAETLANEGDPSKRFIPGASTLSVGVMQGGTARNILAKDCWFHWEFRGLPGVAPDRALRHLESYIAARVMPKYADRAFAPVIETTTEVEVPGLAPAPGSPAEQLAFKLAKANDTIAVSYATEGGRFQIAGIPTVVCGPGSIDQAHQPDEYIDEEQVAAGIEFMRALAREMS